MDKVTKKFIPCRPSRWLMLYGFYSILCQLMFMALHISILLSSHSMEFVRYTYIPLFEYPLLSIVLILGGAWLIDYVTVKSE